MNVVDETGSIAAMPAPPLFAVLFHAFEVLDIDILAIFPVFEELLIDVLVIFHIFEALDEGGGGGGGGLGVMSCPVASLKSIAKRRRAMGDRQL